jgi:hypothetical protein
MKFLLLPFLRELLYGIYPRVRAAPAGRSRSTRVSTTWELHSCWPWESSSTSVLESRRLQNYPWCVCRLPSPWFGTRCGWARSTRKTVISSSRHFLLPWMVNRELGFTETRLCRKARGRVGRCGFRAADLQGSLAGAPRPPRPGLGKPKAQAERPDDSRWGCSAPEYRGRCLGYS